MKDNKKAFLAYWVWILTLGVFTILAVVTLLNMPLPDNITIKSIAAMLSGGLLFLVFFILFSSPFRERLENSFKLVIILLSIFIITGVILRTIFAVWLAPGLGNDFLEYHNNALYILNGDFRDYYTRPLGYPAVLAFMYYLIDPEPFFGKLINVFFGALSILFVYFLGSEFFEKRGYALAGAWVATFFPTQVFMTGILCTEIISTTLFTGSLWLFVGWNKNKKNLYLIMSAIMMGFGLLIRSSLVFHLFWMIAILLVLPRMLSEKIRSSVIFVATVISIQLGFLGWYALVSGDFTFVPLENDVGDYMLLSGTNWESNGFYNQKDADLYWSWPEQERTRYVVETAINRIVSQPKMFMGLVLRKMKTIFAESNYGSYWTFSPFEINGFSPTQQQEYFYIAGILEQGWYVITVFLGWLYTLFSKLKPTLLYLFFGLAIIFIALPHVFLEVQGRYSNTLLPFYSIFAGAGLWVVSGYPFQIEKKLFR